MERHEQLKVVHTGRGQSPEPYTDHQHRPTAAEQGHHRLINNLHRPYYYCCYLSKVFPSKEGPGETHLTPACRTTVGTIATSTDSLSRCPSTLYGYASDGYLQLPSPA